MNLGDEDVMLTVRGLRKSFTVHARGVTIPVLDNLELEVRKGECVALDGPSGTGKSSLIRALFGNYRVDAGQIVLRGAAGLTDIAAASPREILALRRDTIGYVSQFLHVVPRVTAQNIVAGPLRERGVGEGEARDRAAAMLARLNLPEALWHLPPATFSGGERQRVNIAHGLIARHPILLLDEPTSALDRDNRAIVAGLIEEALAEGAAIVAIFHDLDTKAMVATRSFDLAPFRVQ